MKTLVVYYSLSGKTRTVARALSQQLAAGMWLGNLMLVVRASDDYGGRSHQPTVRAQSVIRASVALTLRRSRRPWATGTW